MRGRVDPQSTSSCARGKTGQPPRTARQRIVGGAILLFGFLAAAPAPAAESGLSHVAYPPCDGQPSEIGPCTDVPAGNRELNRAVSPPWLLGVPAEQPPCQDSGDGLCLASPAAPPLPKAEP